MAFLWCLTLFVVGILGVMARMGHWSEVFVTIRDQGGERVDCMRRLHHGDFVGLWRKMQEDLLFYFLNAVKSRCLLCYSI